MTVSFDPRCALSRRSFLRGAAVGVGASVAVGALGAALSGCATPAAAGGLSGSTLTATWGDPVGDGQLRALPGEALLDRVELGPRSRRRALLGRFAHLTDAHVLDASSPARVPFLDRLGPPFESTFRPQEALTAQVLAGAVRAVRGFSPDLVIQGGDLIDNDQLNELSRALVLLNGGVVSPGSGSRGYYGVQLGSDPDPFYYRPDVDAPRHPGLLVAAVRPFRVVGLGLPWVPVLGDHDALVAGELVPTALTRSLAVGDRALWDLPSGLSLPPGYASRFAAPGGSPDGPPRPELVGTLLAQALAGPTVRVPADPSRRELSFEEVIGRLLEGSAASRAATASAGAVGLSVRDATPGRLDYVVDVGSGLRLIVLDLARREGGSGGLVVAGQPEWVDAQLGSLGSRWAIVVSHQALWDSAGGDAVLSVLDRSPRVIATLSGHTHRSRVRPLRSSAGGYWGIETASLVDYPQQARALAVYETEGGGVAIETWMLDHVFPGPLGTISRQLSYLDAQGGRPQRFAGSAVDRNVVLYRGAA